MNYLIDTDLIIDYLNNQKDAKKLFMRLLNNEIKISIITFIEIEYGIKKSSNPDKRKEEFINFINDFSVEILPINFKIAENFIDIKLELENKKTPLADFDLFIASTAIVNKLTLITRNKRHFKRIKDLILG